MTRWMSMADRTATILCTVLCLSVVTSVAAQQATSSPTPAASAVQASAPSATLPGPRLAPALPRFEPSLKASAPGRADVMAASLNDNHTIVITTLGLILLAVIAVLLLA